MREKNAFAKQQNTVLQVSHLFQKQIFKMMMYHASQGIKGVQNNAT